MKKNQKKTVLRQSLLLHTFGICINRPSSVCNDTLGLALRISKRVCIFSSDSLDTLCPSRCDNNAEPERNI